MASRSPIWWDRDKRIIKERPFKEDSGKPAGSCRRAFLFLGGGIPDQRSTTRSDAAARKALAARFEDGIGRMSEHQAAQKRDAGVARLCYCFWARELRVNVKGSRTGTQTS